MTFPRRMRQIKTGMIGRSVMKMAQAEEYDPPYCKAVCQKCGEEVDQLFQSQPGIVCLMVCRGCKAEDKKWVEGKTGSGLL